MIESAVLIQVQYNDEKKAGTILTRVTMKQYGSVVRKEQG